MVVYMICTYAYIYICIYIYVHLFVYLLMCLFIYFHFLFSIYFLLFIVFVFFYLHIRGKQVLKNREFSEVVGCLSATLSLPFIGALGRRVELGFRV